MYYSICGVSIVTRTVRNGYLNMYATEILTIDKDIICLDIVV